MSSRPELQATPRDIIRRCGGSQIHFFFSHNSDSALELLALPDDGVPRLLLDIGCGLGLSGETLSENGHQWIGVDIAQSMLDVALEREVEGDLLLSDMGQGKGQDGESCSDDESSGDEENPTVGCLFS